MTASDFFKPRTFADCAETLERKPKFLIDELVAKVTLLQGPAETGKSSLWLAIGDAVANGKPELFGRKVVTEPVGVTFALSDPDAMSETIRRAKALGISTHGFHMGHVSRLPSNESAPDIFRKIGERCRDNGSGLFVLDNVSGVVPGSVTEDRCVQPLLDGIKILADEYDVWCILAHHSRKSDQLPGGGYVKSKSPAGSYLFEAFPRVTLTTFKVSADMFSLSVRGNAVRGVQNLGYQLEDRNGEPTIVWRPDYVPAGRKDAKQHKRSTGRLARNADLADLIEGAPAGSSSRDVARWLIKKHGGEPVIAEYAQRDDPDKALEALRKLIERSRPKQDKAA